MTVVRRVSYLFALLLAGQAFASNAGPVIDVTAAEIVVHATPRSDVFLIAVAREPMPYHWRIVKRTDVATDADGDGIVRFPRASTSDRAVYGAFDLTTGQGAIAYPAGFRDVPDERVRPRLADSWIRHEKSFAVNGLYVDVILIRPQGKVWHWEGGDGVADDDDASVGGIRVGAGALRPLHGAASPPDSIQPSDLMLFIRADTLEAVIGRAGGAQ